MTCSKCGAKLKKVNTDLPFKVRVDSIVIVKSLPVLQCLNCGDFLIEDPIMEKVDNLLGHIDKATELEILKFA